ncbi:hypothetical protein I5Q31_05620 [Serratia marcescens]|nr:hypothetical protein [Serratia marcescens]MBH2766647.1 hypothetical protein [Serratia marcescens]MBH2766707.1 hypothetical protein [Serratia marcescens]
MPASVPIGTVLAGVEVSGAPEVNGGECELRLPTSRDGRRMRVLTGNVQGVIVRLVMAMPAAPSWWLTTRRWNAQPDDVASLYPLTRIELVKTGLVSPGVLLRVSSDVQRWCRAPGKAWRRVDTLRYAGALSVGVLVDAPLPRIADGERWG